MTLCFGRLQHDPGRLAAAPSLHRFGLPEPKPVLDRSKIDFEPGMYANDIIPDCTAAGLANYATGSSLVAGAAPPFIVSSKVPAFYGDCLNMPGATIDQLAKTNGAVMMDVLDRAYSQGFDIGQQVPLVPVPGTVQPVKEAIAATTDQRGACYLGIRIYQRDEDTFGQGPWTALPSDSGAFLSGHAVVSWDYAGLQDSDMVRVATWGALQPATWEWLLSRLDEAHGLIWPQLAPP